MEKQQQQQQQQQGSVHHQGCAIDSCWCRRWCCCCRCCCCWWWWWWLWGRKSCCSCSFVGLDRLPCGRTPWASVWLLADALVWVQFATFSVNVSDCCTTFWILYLQHLSGFAWSCLFMATDAACCCRCCIAAVAVVAMLHRADSLPHGVAPWNMVDEKIALPQHSKGFSDEKLVTVRE